MVSSRGAVVDVNYKDGDYDGKGDEDHDKEQVFSDQGDHLETGKCKGYSLNQFRALNRDVEG